MIYGIKKEYGFTLIEVIIVVLITGILASLALRSAVMISDTARTEDAKQELEALTTAMIGNPELENNGVRSDFGYVGDVGAMPPDLDALNSNPGSYATWKGPYIDNDFTQKTDDYKRDAWDAGYVFSGVNITSNGSGSDIVRTLGKSVADFTLNQVRGVVFDRNGTPPGLTYRDSVSVRLTIPNGSGGTVTKSTTVDVGGYFSFDSVPIGNHDLNVIYLPDNDTLTRFVSVLPASSPYGEYSLVGDVWAVAGGGGSGGLEYVAGSANTQTGNCDRFEFDITNTTGGSITVTSMMLTWTTPTAYYQRVKFDGGGWVFDSTNPRAASGDTVTFGSSKVVVNGATVTILVDKFEDVATGNGNKVDMSNTDMTAVFSDGSTVVFNTGACN